VAIDGEDLVSDRFNSFVHGKHAGVLANLLFVGAIRGHPNGDEVFLFFVQRELYRSVLPIALFPRSEVRSEAPVRFRRNLLREPLVGRDVEQQPTPVGFDVAPFGRWWRMRDGALALVRKESVRDALAPGASSSLRFERRATRSA
jgi:hypothetical protein